MARRGAKVSVYAVQPFGGSGYTTARLQVVQYREENPTNAQEAMDLWFALKPMAKSTVHSNLFRKLPASGGHVAKVVYDINSRCKANIVLFPNNVDKLQPTMQKFLEDIEQGVPRDSSWANHQRWIMPGMTRIVGGVVYQRAKPVAERIVHENHAGTDGAWAMIQQWLDSNLPIVGLSNWVRYEKYMEDRT